MDFEQKMPDPEFVLRCLVDVREISYQDVQSKETVQRSEKMVFLIPQEGTQRSFFFAKWLPDVEKESPEIAMVIPYPVNGFVRGCVCRRDHRCPEHHIFVMSRGAEEDLKNIHGKTIEILVLHESLEYVLDGMKNYDLIGKKDMTEESLRVLGQ